VVNGREAELFGAQGERKFILNLELWKVSSRKVIPLEFQAHRRIERSLVGSPLRAMPSNTFHYSAEASRLNFGCYCLSQVPNISLPPVVWESLVGLVLPCIFVFFSQVCSWPLLRWLLPSLKTQCTSPFLYFQQNFPPTSAIQKPSDW
jgi:hypothetical protein